VAAFGSVTAAGHDRISSSVGACSDVPICQTPSIEMSGVSRAFPWVVNITRRLAPLHSFE
jgi:hypothetical protein